jgi:murein DD-endopeptidase MepM/ murein hydrolase activator NlpD
MRLTAFVAALLFAAVFFAAGNTNVKAQSQNNQQQNSKKVEVKGGDTLDGIAKQHETNYRRLFDANLEIKDPDLIYVGDKVRIPRLDEQLKQRPLPGVQPTAPAPERTQPATVRKPKPVARTKPVTKPAPAPGSAVSGSVWDRLAMCESGGNWTINTGNGYYGGLQFTLSSWQAVGGSGYPHHASKAEQIARGERLLATQGWGAWPACSSKLGLR